MSLLEETIARIVPTDATARAQARVHLDQITMPFNALQTLTDMAERLAGITRNQRPSMARRLVVVFSGDHGVAEENVMKYPQDVTPQMSINFVNGGAGINAVARATNTDVKVADCGVKGDLLKPYKEDGRIIDLFIAPGTRNFIHEPAMTRAQALQSIENGIRLALDLIPQYDVVAAGEMGSGNSTPATALVSTFVGLPVSEVVGPGSGVYGSQLEHKAKVVQMGLDLHNPNVNDPIGALAAVGGFEIGAMAGFNLGAAALRKPILVDGFIASSSALIAQALCPTVTEYFFGAHKSMEPGHIKMLNKLGLQPLLDLNFRLGEGSGAAMAMPIIDAAARMLTDVATFAEAGVSHP
jgi:nicotinate-nucleotide--dimethylbenzimidazole phosphoribosyltransferase